MTRKQILHELMKKYSFEEVQSIIQIATEDREYEDENVHVIMTRSLDGDVFQLQWKNQC